MTITDWLKDIHEYAKAQGWVDENQFISRESISEKLMLIVTEVAEAMEELRKPVTNLSDVYQHDKTSVGALTVHVPWNGDARIKPEGFGIELADIVIRVFQLSAMLGIDLESMMRIKMSHNLTRGVRHGGKTC